MPADLFTFWLPFLLLVAAGSYLQAVAGFAMGMLVMAVGTGLGLAPVPVLAAVVSLLALVNIAQSLHGHYHLVHGLGLRWLALGQVLGVPVGVLVLGVLSATAATVLQVLLGLFIVAGSLSMMLRPVLRAAVSGRWGFLGAGLSGGVLGGLFAASGPVIGWFTYRQPLPVKEIRATLLGCFAVSTVTRTLVVGATGGLTRDVWWMALLALPVVLLATGAARRFPPVLPEPTLRRLAFGVLLLTGLWLVLAPLVVAPPAA